MNLENRLFKIKLPTFAAILILAVGISVTCFLPRQSDFGILISGYLLAFVAYGYLVVSGISEKALIASAIIITIIPCLAFPNLSDDIYRFYWDGYLTTQGISPYAYTPEMTKHMGELNDIYPLLNSPTYYSIYPLVSQVIFAASVWIGGNLEATTFIIKGIYLIVHLSGLYASLKTTKLIQLPKVSLAIYYLNPLVLVEGLGNLHAEVMMVAFLAWFIYFIQKSQYISSGISLGMAVGTKLLPLIFVPYLFFNLKGYRRIYFFMSLLISLIVLFMPIAWALNFMEFGSSVDLYFRKFEFNASIYYLLRAIGSWIYGYNMIHTLGPALGLSIMFYVVWSSWLRLLDFATMMEVFLFSFTAYLFLTTTVHPWYIITILYISIWTKYRYALVWSFLVCFTYINYAYKPYHENLWVVALEYAIVFGLFWREIKVQGIRI